uniref:Cell number regulator 8-like n=1 Tax=Fagus sylvatica TaxID=28930 RepID=A0A2N9FC68_FAGSY
MAANNNENNDNHEESNPLLGKQFEEEEQQQDAKKPSKLVEADAKPKTDKVSPVAKAPSPGPGNVVGYTWTADGLPLGHGSVVGEPMGRTHWNSGLCACLGRNDEFCSSDLEVCVLGSVAPCVLYGSNAERLGSNPGFVISLLLILRKGSFEALHRSCGCCGSFLEDEVQREQCETACDFATHVFCHTCAICQEGREIRRRLPHPGFNAQPFLVMIPPVEQAMGRAA